MDIGAYMKQMKASDWALHIMFALAVAWLFMRVTFGWIIISNMPEYEDNFVATIAAVSNDLLERPLAMDFSNGAATASALGAGLLGAFLYLMVWLYFIDCKKTFMKGQEHGSAAWGTHTDIAPFIDSDYGNNVLFTATERMSINTHKTRRNLNMLVIGGSGSGKTRFFVKPNLMQMNTSYVITDPKGELLDSTAGMFKEAGYKVKVFNLVDMSHSNAYNPFVYIRDDKDVTRLIRTLIKNTTPPDAQKGDPFWEKSETALLQALLYYLYYEAPPDEQNFSMVMELLRAAEVREGQEDFKSDLDRLFDMLEEKNPNHIALKQYAIFKQAAGQTAKSILVSTSVRLGMFNIRDVGALTITDNIELSKLGDEKTVLYAVIPDSHDTYNFIVAMMYSQIFEALFTKADFEYGGRLPVHVRFMLDEFANIGALPDFEKMLATMRSREVSASIIIQNLAQLKTMYKDSWESITGNCDSTIFLGGQEQATLKYFSEMLGKRTIDNQNQSRSGGKNNSTSTSYQNLGRNLMDPDEIARMPNDTCLFMLRGIRPFKSKKMDITRHPNYAKLYDGKGVNPFQFRDHFATPYGAYDDFFREFK